MAILVIAFFVLAIALEATGHVVFRGRLILLGRGGRWLLMWWALACELAGLASFFGQFKGLTFPLIEALGVGPVNVGAGDAVEGGQSVARTCAGAGPFGVYDRDSGVGLACGFVGRARVHQLRRQAAEAQQPLPPRLAPGSPRSRVPADPLSRPTPRR